MTTRSFLMTHRHPRLTDAERTALNNAVAHVREVPARHVLVREGVAFREAHEAVGRLVGHCTREGIDLRELSQEQLAEFHAAFPGSGAALLDLEASVEARGLRGGTARALWPGSV